MPAPQWRVNAQFASETQRFNASLSLADADGTLVGDADDTPIGGMVRVIVEREQITGAKPFDALVKLEAIELNYDDLTTTIANGASVSAVVTLQRRPILTILVPSDWDDAALTFQVSQDGQTYYELLDEDGAYVSLTVAAGRFIRVDNPDQWSGFQYMKVRSGTFAVPVVQTPAKTLTLTVRDA